MLDGLARPIGSKREKEEEGGGEGEGGVIKEPQ